MDFLDRVLRWVDPAGFAKPPEPQENWDGVAYAYWIAGCDGKGCAWCREHHLVYWLHEIVGILEPPKDRSTRKGGCFCQLVWAMEGNPEDEETARFLRSVGGRATQTELAAYEERKLGPLREQARLEGVSAAAALAARASEVADPDRAAALYAEAIAATVEATRRFPDSWASRDIPYLYNRLTLVLERAGRHAEALGRIAEYVALPVGRRGMKADREALAKRMVRLVAKTR